MSLGHISFFIFSQERKTLTHELIHSSHRLSLSLNSSTHSSSQFFFLLKPVTYMDSRGNFEKTMRDSTKEMALLSLDDSKPGDSKPSRSRSIASMIDGLKLVQRKIIFCAFKWNFVNEVTVSYLAAYVYDKTAYRGSDRSLVSTIVRMAQNFVGTNNINLLQPDGYFGSRLGGSHGCACHIGTRLNPITRLLFPKDDDDLLEYLNDDHHGQSSIEPIWYIPIIPMVLVNGVEGKDGSPFVPKYNPKDIIANLIRKLKGDPLKRMHPWYKGFAGGIRETGEKGVYAVSGTIQQSNVNTEHLTITELPIRKWTIDGYHEFIKTCIGIERSEPKRRGDREGWEDAAWLADREWGDREWGDRVWIDKEWGQRDGPFIKDSWNYSSPDKVRFDVIVERNEHEKKSLLEEFELLTEISTTNMRLTDSNGVLKKYETPEEILEEFYSIRLKYYEKRKTHKLKELKILQRKLEMQRKFIQALHDGTLVLSDVHPDQLKKKGFEPFPTTASSGAAGEDPDEAIYQGNLTSGYDYLLSLRRDVTFGMLTHDLKNVEGIINDMKEATPESLWLNDLNNLEKHLDEQDEAKKQRDEQAAAKAIQNQARWAAKRKLVIIDDALPKNKVPSDIIHGRAVCI